jgi:hypothetical protein
MGCFGVSILLTGGDILTISKEAQEKMAEIRAIEEKYGYMPFRMGLTHLMDTGINNLDDDSVEEVIRQIIAQGESDKANGIGAFISPELKCRILRCSGELTKFGVMTLFAYIKEHVVIGI